MSTNISEKKQLQFNHLFGLNFHDSNTNNTSQTEFCHIDEWLQPHQDSQNDNWSDWLHRGAFDTDSTLYDGEEWLQQFSNDSDNNRSSALRTDYYYYMITEPVLLLDTWTFFF